MKLKIAQAQSLKFIVDAIKDLARFATFKCQKDQVTLCCLDDSHVSMIHLVLPREYFEVYECDVPQDIGLSMIHFSKAINCLTQTMPVELHCKPAADKLSILGKDTEFIFPLMTIEEPLVEVGEVDFQGSATVDTKEFKEKVADLSILECESCRIVIGENSITLQSEGLGECGLAFFKINATECQGNSYGRFRFKYLKYFIKAAALSKTIVISVAPNDPTRITFRFDPGYLVYYVGPLLVTEEEEAEAEVQTNKRQRNE